MGAVFIIVSTGMFVFWALDERDHEIETAQLKTRDLSLTYKAYTEQVLENFDQLLKLLVSAYANPSLNSVQTSLDQLIRQRVQNTPFSINIGVFGPDGEPLHWSSNNKPLNASERDFFSAHRNRSASGLHVTSVLSSRMFPGHWFFALSRRIEDQQGKFLGVAVAFVDVEGLGEAYQRMMKNEDMTVGLIHLSGEMITRVPFLADSIGKKIPFIARFQGNVPEFATTMEASPVDGAMRIISQWRLEGYPLVIAVTVLRDSVLAGWRQNIAIAALLWLAIEMAALTALILLLRQIKGQSRAAGELRSAFDLLNGILNSATDLIVAVDTNQRYIAVNPTYASEFYRITGHRIELGQSVAESLASQPEELVKTEKSWRRAIAGESFAAIWSFEDTNEEREYFEISYSPLRAHDGATLGAVQIVHKISERVRSEKRLTEMVEFNAQIFSASPLGIAAFRADGPCVMANEALARIIGASRDTVLAQNFRTIASWQSSGLLDNALAALASGQPRELETQLVTTFGKPAWIHVRLTSFTRGDTPHLLMLLEDIAERKRAEETRERLLDVLNAARDFVGSADTEGRLTYFNRAAREAVGLTEDEDVSQSFIHDYHPQESVELLQTVALPTAEQHGYWEGETEFLTRQGKRIPVSQVIVAHRNAEGVLQAFSTIARDISERRRQDAELRLAASVYHNTIEGIVITDPAGIILSVNPAFTEITGYSPEEAIGQTPRILKSDHHDEAFYAELWKTIAETGQWQGELWNRRKNGEVFLEWQNINVVKDANGKPLRYVAVFNDVTELRRKDESLKHLAYHDALTGLANRMLLTDRLEHSLDVARRDIYRVAVLFLDLDRFKVVNDSLGHEKGDLLLQAVARRLEVCMRKSDTVARLGGDEFVIVLTDFDSSAEIAHMAERIIALLLEPIDLDGHEVHVSASLGIAVFPQDGADAASLMKNADIAMYQSKQAGRSTFRFFDTTMNTRAIERLDLEASLRRALSNEEFELFYQPKFDLASRAAQGVEALIRWRNPQLGLVSPADFIPLAEETGLIEPIGDWAIEEACRQMASWRKRGSLIRSVAVNLSARQFQNAKLVERVNEILAKTGLTAEALEIELTESTVMGNPAQAAATLGRLRQIGVSVAVDDFGTGYSSLSYLKRLPISTLKVDRSFVTDLGVNPEDAAIVRTIVALGKSLNLLVVAEGVETEEQAAFLAGLGCDMAQGYLYAKPMPPSELDAWFSLREK
jgi:diguanylate cyclase (GGDEF)-like protein/PAS domain S-box-containing protein